MDNPFDNLTKRLDKLEMLLETTLNHLRTQQKKQH